MTEKILSPLRTLVTGGAGGIGQQIVRELIMDGALVSICDVAPNHNGLAESRSGDITYYQVDLSDDGDVEKLAKRCVENNINSIVHCAGFGGPFNSTEDTTLHDWQQVFKVNVTSLFSLSRALLPNMREQRFGRLVAVSSIQGNLGSNGSSAYVASKHALNGLMKTIASEYGQYGVTANVVAPGYIASPMGADDAKVDDYMNKVINRTPTHAIGTSDQIARMVALLLDPGMPYANGGVFTIDGGISSSVGVV